MVFSPNTFASSSSFISETQRAVFLENKFSFFFHVPEVDEYLFLRTLKRCSKYAYALLINSRDIIVEKSFQVILMLRDMHKPNKLRQ